jgi:hypothetical protein
MSNADYDWVVRDPFEAFSPEKRVQPHTEPAGWRSADEQLAAARDRRQAASSEYTMTARTARDIRTIKWLLRVAVGLLALMILGGAAGAGFAASFWHAPVYVCRSLVSRC